MVVKEGLAPPKPFGTAFTAQRISYSTTSPKWSARKDLHLHLLPRWETS